MEEPTGWNESTGTVAAGDTHPAEGRRSPTWRGWALSILVAVLLWLCALAVGSVARAEEPAEPVHRYIDAALADNPSLESMRERIRMKESAAIKAGALADPKLWMGIVNLPTQSWDFREEDMTGKEIGLSQMFPWPGMRKTREEMALREKEEAEFVLEEMRSTLRSEIKMTYAELASVRKQIEAVRRSQDVLKDIVGVTEEIYAVGKGSQPDVLRGQLEYGRIREMRIGLENREQVLSVRLNTLAALPADRPVPPLGDLLGDPAPLRTGRSCGDLRGGAACPQGRTGPGPQGRLLDPDGEPRRQARVRGLRLLHAAGRHARRDEALRHGFLDGDDDPADLAEGKNRAGDPGDGSPKRGWPGRISPISISRLPT